MQNLGHHGIQPLYERHPKALLVGVWSLHLRIATGRCSILYFWFDSL